MSGDDLKLIAVAVAVVVLLAVWFGWLALRGFRRRMPHSKSVTSAAEKVFAMDAGHRPEKIELTEHLARLVSCEPPIPEVGAATGKRGYLALTDTHLSFVPYHRAEPVVLDRSRLGDPASKHRKVWKKTTGTFDLAYRPPATRSEGDGSLSAQVGSSVLRFKVRQPYTWLFKFGFRSGLTDDPFG